jgi:hypothetical protein
MLLVWALAVAAQSQGWYCVDTFKQHTDLRPCRPTKGDCEKRRRHFIDDGWKVGSCRFQDRAAIVRYFDILQDQEVYVAYGSLQDCRNVRDSLLAAPDDHTQVSECYGASSPPW